MNNEKSACFGKVKHSSKNAAWFATRKTVNRELARRLVAYKCKYCGYWHTGHGFKTKYSQVQSLFDRIQIND